jgi:soluble lytic murein transglycosylase-like protein
MGMTQLMPATARALGVTDPFDPAENLRGGARYLASNLRIYGRVDLALAAYQAGKGTVSRAGGIPDSPTTHRYIDRILTTWSGLLQGDAP